MLTRKNGLVLAAGLFISTLAVACGDSSGDDDGTDATPVDATLSSIQSAVFTPTCAMSGCHTGSSASEELDMSAGMTYADTVGVPAVQLPSMSLIDPGSPDTSYLWLKLVNQHGDAGGSGAPMPLVGSVSQEQLDAIEQWILAGAEDN
jgi:hypothetical protein